MTDKQNEYLEWLKKQWETHSMELWSFMSWASKKSQLFNAKNLNNKDLAEVWTVFLSTF